MDAIHANINNILLAEKMLEKMIDKDTLMRLASSNKMDHSKVQGVEVDPVLCKHVREEARNVDIVLKGACHEYAINLSNSSEDLYHVILSPHYYDTEFPPKKAFALSSDDVLKLAIYESMYRMQKEATMPKKATIVFRSVGASASSPKAVTLTEEQEKFNQYTISLIGDPVNVRFHIYPHKKCHITNKPIPYLICTNEHALERTKKMIDNAFPEQSGQLYRVSQQPLTLDVSKLYQVFQQLQTQIQQLERELNNVSLKAT